MPYNGLHHAASYGYVKLAAELLSKASTDIDEQHENGFTPLMVAAQQGHHHVVKILLQHGAGLGIVSNDKATALTLSAQFGRFVVAKLLADAGAELEYSNKHGCTALHLAAGGGYFGVVKVLIGAGANIEASNNYGSTVLHLAAQSGDRAVVEELVAAGANPVSLDTSGRTPMYVAAVFGFVDAVNFFMCMQPNPYTKAERYGGALVALEGATEHNHAEVVRELLRFGVEAVGGPTGGRRALWYAAQKQDLDVMVMLRDAGVVDDGEALIAAANHGLEASVKFLLRQPWATPGGAYVNGHALLKSSDVCLTLCYAIGSASPRIVRLLLDAGADETLGSRHVQFGEVSNETALAITDRYLDRKSVRKGEIATEKQLNQLQGIRRMILRVEAIRAISWLWPSNIAPSQQDHAATKEPPGGGPAPIRSTALAQVVRMIRHREGVRRAIPATLFRWAASGMCKYRFFGVSGRWFVCVLSVPEAIMSPPLPLLAASAACLPVFSSSRFPLRFRMVCCIHRVKRNIYAVILNQHHGGQAGMSCIYRSSRCLSHIL